MSGLLTAHPGLPPPRTPADQSRVHAMEFETTLSPIGRLCLPNNHQINFAAALGNRVATIWAGERSVHVFIDGDHVHPRPRPSTLTADDLQDLIQRGGRAAHNGLTTHPKNSVVSIRLFSHRPHTVVQFRLAYGRVLAARMPARDVEGNLSGRPQQGLPGGGC